MKINRTNLQRSLEIVKPGLDNKEVIGQTGSFAFIEGRVITYNDKISLSHPVEGIDFEGALRAEELYGLLTQLSRDEIDLTLNDSELKVKCGRVKAGLRLEALLAEDNKSLRYVIDDQKLMHEKKWKKIPEPDTFMKHLKFAMASCSSDMTNLALTCVHVKKEGIIQSTDRLRVVQCYGQKLPVDSFLIAATAIPDVLKIKPTKIAKSSGWIHFSNPEDTVLSCRIVHADYYPQESLDKILDVGKYDQITFPQKLDDMLAIARQFAKRDFVFDEIIEIVIENNRLKVYAEAMNTGSWVEDSATIESPKDLSFWITPVLFIDILKETRDCMLDKGMSKAKFKAKDGSWEYVVVLGSEKK